MRRTLRLFALILPLAACQLALPGRDAAPDAPPTATGGAITTTPLDAPPVAAPSPETAAAEPATPAPASAAKAPPQRPTQAEPAPTEAAAEPIPEPVATPIPKSEAQLACEDDGGTWARTDEGAVTYTCVQTTRDGGKRCDEKSDCQGECLARSRSCAPVTPLFGCNAVLTDNGSEVTLCLN